MECPTCGIHFYPRDKRAVYDQALKKWFCCLAHLQQFNKLRDAERKAHFQKQREAKKQQELLVWCGED